MSVSRYLATLVVVVCWINESHSCDLSRCQSIRPTIPITLKQPTTLSDCSSETKFETQIHHNYNIMYNALENMECSCNEKDFNEFKALLSEMKAKIVGIVDAYYRCNKNDPSDDINVAIASYDSTRKRFRAYGRNGFNKLSSKCNSVIQYVRRLPYISAENTIMSMVTCARLKTER